MSQDKKKKISFMNHERACGGFGVPFVILNFFNMNNKIHIPFYFHQKNYINLNKH